ncbi:Ig-like domain-containing protein, partial [Verrucomicrobiota bacterium]
MIRPAVYILLAGALYSAGAPAAPEEEPISLDGVGLSMPALVSINRTNIPVQATVTRAGKPVSDATVTFSSDDLHFPSPTAVTDARGSATVMAHSGDQPSHRKDATFVQATTPGLIGGRHPFTIVRVNDPVPANPEILVGHLPINHLYTVLLTYNISPPIEGVPISFRFHSREGWGVNYPATLEELDAATDADGLAAVRVRSSDLREKPVVKCWFQASSGSTRVTFAGIT